MLQGDNQPIKDMLCRTRIPRVESLADYLKSPVKFEEKIYILFLRQKTKITNDTRNILLVVAALLVTITFQIAVNPPGGVWQDDSAPPTTNTSNSTATGYSPPSHFAGAAIMEPFLFLILAFLNLISFCVTVCTIFVLLPGDFSSGLFSVPLYILSLFFVASLWITAPINIIGGPVAIYFSLLLL
ncbi:hypothetical protein SLA2020_387700 [Shorea laevis]